MGEILKCYCEISLSSYPVSLKKNVGENLEQKHPSASSLDTKFLGLVWPLQELEGEQRPCVNHCVSEGSGWASVSAFCLHCHPGSAHHLGWGAHTTQKVRSFFFTYYCFCVLGKVKHLFYSY